MHAVRVVCQKKETESVEKERIQTKTPSLPVSDSESRHD